MSEIHPLQQVLAPLETAHGLPNACYTDDAHFALEKKQVLQASWMGVGFGKDIPAPGDAKPVEFIGMPLLLVRDKQAQIRVYQNTCRHRGMILMQEPTNIKKVIRCPYHSWCYALDGSLQATPHVGGAGCNTHPDIKRAELGLFEIRSHVWRDVVFINVDGQAPPFEQHAAELITRWKDFDQPLHHGGESSSIRFKLDTNWKLAIENFCESYHLPWIHPGLNSYSRLQDHYHIELPGTASGQGTRVYRQLEGQDGSHLADFEALPERWHAGGEYVALYPNVLFGVQRDHAYAIVVEPLSQHRTVEHLELYYAESLAQTPLTETHRLRETNTRLWHTVFEEDIFVVEGMQRGRHGPLFDGGRFSPAMDGPTHAFHHWVASRLTPGSVGQKA